MQSNILIKTPLDLSIKAGEEELAGGADRELLHVSAEDDEVAPGERAVCVDDGGVLHRRDVPREADDLENSLHRAIGVQFAIDVIPREEDPVGGADSRKSPRADLHVRTVLLEGGHELLAPVEAQAESIAVGEG